MEYVVWAFVLQITNTKRGLKILNIKKPYQFAFKESKKEIPLKIDNIVHKNSFSLYSELNAIMVL